MSEYRFNEGSIDIALAQFTDRTANMLILGEPATSRFNITISRDRLEPGETLPDYVTRQIALMAKNIKGHQVARRGGCALGPDGQALVGEYIDASHPSGGKTYFQRQAAFVLGEPFRDRVLVFSATRDRPLDADFEGHWAQLLASFRPREP